MQQAEEDT
jgi:hypothetical protein